LRERRPAALTKRRKSDPHARQSHRARELGDPLGCIAGSAASPARLRRRLAPGYPETLAQEKSERLGLATGGPACAGTRSYAVAG